MTATPGDTAVAGLLRSLPAALTERLLVRMSPAASNRLRARLGDSQPVSPELLDAALSGLAEVIRSSSPSNGSKPPQPQTTDDSEPIPSLRNMPADQLVAVLRSEQPIVIAWALSCLDAAPAAEMLKRLPAEMRPEVTLRLSEARAGNPELLKCLAAAVVARCRQPAEVHPEPTADDRVFRTVTLLRALNRPERLEILRRIEESDAVTAAQIAEQLYQFADLLRIEDRALQGVLAETDLRTLAMALFGADAALSSKVSANVSSRARDTLTEETSLLGKPPQSKIDEARASILAAVRRFENEGKLSLDS